MSGSRKSRGALACVLWASVIVCFLTTGTTRHPPRSVKLRGLPLRVDVGEGKGFWAAVQNAANRSKTDDQTHMESIVALAPAKLLTGVMRYRLWCGQWRRQDCSPWSWGART